jgi:hypothetical protein
VCPRCGNAANVHSIEELAGMARMRLAQMQPGGGGMPPPGPGPGGGAQQGWAAEPQAGPLPGPGGRPSYTPPMRDTTSADYSSGDGLSALEGDIAGAVVGAAMRWAGRAAARKIGSKFNAAVPAMMAKQEAMLRQQIAIAERHPDLRACMTDQVIFLAGGSRTAPFTSATTSMTVEQSDALVAQLRG